MANMPPGTGKGPFKPSTAERMWNNQAAQNEACPESPVYPSGVQPSCAQRSDAVRTEGYSSVTTTQEDRKCDSSLLSTPSGQQNVDWMI